MEDQDELARWPYGDVKGIDWEVELAAARARRERARKNPWNKLVHWVHAVRYPQRHREICSCRGTRKLT